MCIHVKFVLLLAALLLFGDSLVCLCAEPLPQPCTQPLAGSDCSNTGVSDRSDDPEWLETMKGRKARDAILLGMWSLHIDGSGRNTGEGDNDENNRLIGVQYYGLTTARLC